MLNTIERPGAGGSGLREPGDVSDTALGGVPAQTLLLATAAGVLLGFAYALSPLLVWFGAAILGIAAWAGRGLTERERRWVLGIFAMAVAVRLLAIAWLFLTRDPAHQYLSSFFFDGDGRALKLRSMWVKTAWSGGHLDAHERFGAFNEIYGWTSYLWVLGYLQYLFGPAPYGIHLFNIALFMAASVFWYRFVRTAYGRLAAAVRFGFVLFLPTMFMWSIAALKESMQFFLMSVTILGALSALSGQSWTKRIVAAVIAVLSLMALNTVRNGVLELATGAIVLGAAGTFVARRRYLLYTFPILLLLVGGYAFQRAPIQSRFLAQMRKSASLHMGNVRTEGHAYRILDRRFYVDVTTAELMSSMTEPESLRFVFRGLASFVVVPLPWDVTSRSELVFLPAQVVWYAVFLLACVGFLPGLWRNALLTLTLAAYGVVGALIITLNNGNVGTLVRHRDLVAPIVVWLAAVGAVRLYARFAAPVSPQTPPSRVPDPAVASVPPAVQSSVVLSWLRRVTEGSLVFGIAKELLTRRSTGIDSGIPPGEDTLAADFAATIRRSRLFDRVVRIAVFWREARIVGFLARHLEPLTNAQRVRLLGWTVVVAVAAEAIVSTMSVDVAGPFDRSAQLLTLALALLFIAANRVIASAWVDKRRDPDRGGAGDFGWEGAGNHA